MKTTLAIASLLMSLSTMAQNPNTSSPLDGRNLGIVLTHPDTKKVTVKTNVTYLSDTKGTLKLDLYIPSQLKAGEKRPVIVFLNAIGDDPNPSERRVKDWGVYQTWPQMMAAQGFIGVSMEADRSRVQESLRGVFNFLTQKGAEHHIDSDNIGVYAASANVSQAVEYLMGESAHKGIKAAALYYGQAPVGPFRKDLPVLFLVAEGDVRGDGYDKIWSEVMKNKAPWRLLMASNMPHAFDTFSGNDEARKLILETISFWKNQLEPVPAQQDLQAASREIFAASFGHQSEKAAELLKSWVAKHPNDATALSMYGGALRDLKQYDEAFQTYRKAVALQPKNPSALTSLAVLSYLTNKPAEADGYVSKAIAINGENRNLYASLAFPLLASGKFSESIPYYQKAIKLEPHGGDYYNLGCAYSLIKEKEKALDALEQAVKLGYGSKQQFDSDPDLELVRSEDRYKKLFPATN
ncbi:tetratricopeptide repeat protein [Spirosoma sp. BT702]|uniref:Tetratricopeptide repeat protein n=1 Tax=Spirosoma profusum TaxID=2771354 RepID=A0A927APU7_9BACT|nr:tetratricopeptide repeat protein [Spirosoma profusum]MBD2699071.1 tetratricopeptide repeat protein [Spirosoma profusum]